mmetsp:Transcript_28886/g.67820  ORF Transcript_28886/g.67820 Transcript_28886/m.67820 type:complete len:205 (-) Transcript_28886:303-917(-)
MLGGKIIIVFGTPRAYRFVHQSIHEGRLCSKGQDAVQFRNGSFFYFDRGFFVPTIVDIQIDLALEGFQFERPMTHDATAFAAFRRGQPHRVVGIVVFVVLAVFVVLILLVAALIGILAGGEDDAVFPEAARGVAELGSFAVGSHEVEFQVHTEIVHEPFAHDQRVIPRGRCHRVKFQEGISNRNLQRIDFVGSTQSDGELHGGG